MTCVIRARGFGTLPRTLGCTSIPVPRSLPMLMNIDSKQSSSLCAGVGGWTTDRTSMFLNLLIPDSLYNFLWLHHLDAITLGWPRLELLWVLHLQSNVTTYVHLLRSSPNLRSRRQHVGRKSLRRTAAPRPRNDLRPIWAIRKDAVYSVKSAGDCGYDESANWSAEFRLTASDARPRWREPPKQAAAHVQAYVFWELGPAAHLALILDLARFGD